MPKIKKERSIKIETLCDFDEVDMEVEKDGRLKDQNKQEYEITGTHQGNDAIQESRDQELREESKDRKSISFDCVPNVSGDAHATDSQDPRKETRYN
ncbi:hypothetical protein FCM35_KLT21180 [Carex littledalei]|uniref:Uncharacterized protein n=1 Tax=Carex littledalei TaxID=544730 RepID=A0A833R7M1_9POAL|nr:hypothetical protein FCM35_KLT21180 [Carex littledalei]